MFNIRNFREDEKDEEKQVKNLVYNLSEYYPNIENWFSKKIEKIKSGEINCYIACFDGEIIGISISEEKIDGVAKISTFYVKEEYQSGYAIGPRLLLKEINRWSNKNFRYLYVTFACEEFEELSSFFSRYGFQIEGYAPQRYRKDKYEVIMGKTLVSEVIEEKEFSDIIEKYLFKLKGYEIEDTNPYKLAKPKTGYSKRFISDVPSRKEYYFNVTTQKENLKKELEKFNEVDGNKVFVSFYGIRNEVKDSFAFRILDAYEIETIFYPIYLKKEKQNPVLIPIKKEYADNLIPLKDQTIVGKPDPLLNRTRNIYYKSPSGQNVINPGTTILWYVLDEGQIRGESKLKGYEISDVNELWENYKNYGIFDKEDISRHSDGEGRSMALEFDWYKEYDEPIDIKELGDLKYRQQLGRISEEKLEKIREKGFRNDQKPF